MFILHLASLLGAQLPWEEATRMLLTAADSPDRRSTPTSTFDLAPHGYPAAVSESPPVTYRLDINNRGSISSCVDGNATEPPTQSLGDTATPRASLCGFGLKIIRRPKCDQCLRAGLSREIYADSWLATYDFRQIPRVEYVFFLKKALIGIAGAPVMCISIFLQTLIFLAGDATAYVSIAVS